METYFSKDFFGQTFYGNTLQQWTVALAFILGSVLFAKLLYLFFGRFIKRITARTKTNLDDILVDMLEEPVVFAVIIMGIWIGISQLNLSAGASHWVGKLYVVLITVNITWLIHRVFNALIEEYVRPLTLKSESDLDDQLFPILKKGITVIVWILGIIIALNNAGYDVGALIAGLGIGGIALAMAAKDTVSNIFGGFTIFTDKPFKVGERVRIGAYDGNVTEIGIRSFRLRTVEGTIVTIPNMKVTEGMIENVSLELARKITTNLGMTYSTTPEQMQEAMEILRNIAIEHPCINDDYKVTFNKFDASSMNIQFIYWIIKDSDILKTQTDVNMSILSKFSAKGLQFAFPSQTIYMAK